MLGRGIKSEYQKTSAGNVTTFTVTPATPNVIWGFLIAGVVVFLIGLAFGSAGGGAEYMFFVMGALGIWSGLRLDVRPKKDRGPSSFQVTAEGVTIDGRTLARSDMHRLIMRNAVTDQEVIQQIHVGGAQMAGGMVRGAQSRIAFSLSAEAGGRATWLAGGMDEVTANGLMTDVSRILKFD